MTGHLAYDKHDVMGRNGGNSRNGTRIKTVLTEIGPVEIEVPRDRDGTFEPAIVRKRQRLWVPNRSSTSRSLGMFIDHPVETITASELKASQCGPTRVTRGLAGSGIATGGLPDDGARPERGWSGQPVHPELSQQQPGQRGQDRSI